MIRPVLVNSIPKAGTHLLARALSLAPGVQGEYARLAPDALAPTAGEETIDIGIGLPRRASLERVRNTLGGLAPGQFALWHVPYSQRAAEVLRELRMAMLIAVRDPRDLVVSHAMHIASFHGHRLHGRLAHMSDSERIDVVINGLRDGTAGELLLESVARRYAHLLRWRDYKPCHLVRFEDLIGERGGGSAELQRCTLRDLLTFVGASADDGAIERIAAEIFGGTVTFRRGRIGGWREVLDEQQIRTIEEQCGDAMRALGYVKHSAASRRSSAGARRPPPFIVNSFPKSGTKLLTKICAMLPGVAAMAPDARWRALSMMGEGWASAPAQGTAGARPAQPTSCEDAERILASLPAGRFVEHHIAYSHELAALLHARQIRMLMMVRDPRDATVSLVDYLLKAAHHPLHRFFASLPAEERLKRAIMGVTHAESGGAELLGVAARYRRRLGWLREPCVQVVRFEDLVGPAGGGEAERQRDALRAVLQHLGLERTPALVATLAESSFGGTRTFHHGTVGRWSSVFSPEHRALWAASSGDILEALGYSERML